MADDGTPPLPEPSGLQFDRAETRASQPGAPARCAGCKQPLVAQYYLAGPSKVCAACKSGWEQHLASGSKSARVLKATLLGLLAALVGGGLWAAIIIQTNYMLGIIAIGMGYLVGIAVRKGSEARGGRGYQFLGMGLVYVAVATGYMGVGIAKYMEDKTPASATVQPAKPGNPAPATPAGTSPSVGANPGPGGCVGAFLMLLLFYGGTPLLVGKEDPFTLVFLAIALYQAWKLNRGLAIRIS